MLENTFLLIFKKNKMKSIFKQKTKTLYIFVCLEFRDRFKKLETINKYA